MTKRYLKRLKRFNFENFLFDDKKALRFLDDLGFVHHFECRNKEGCENAGTEIKEINQKWYFSCTNQACRNSRACIKFTE